MTSHPPAPRIDGVLFDATGTLFDTAESVGTVYGRAAEAHGISLPAWRLDDAFNRIVASAPPRVFPDCDASRAAQLEQGWWRKVVRSTFLAADSTVVFPDPNAFYDSLFDAYKEAGAWKLRTGVAEGLRELKRRGIATGVVSNFDQRLPMILQALEVASFLDIVITPAVCGFEKPDPGIFKAALLALGTEASATLFVGDHPEKDRSAAERVGMRSLDPDVLESLQDISTHIGAETAT
ncbi:MAG: HAD-IA family hydrolase [Myxococcota bacterium]